ncbi:hypothetical protein WR25_16726 [Diploscapter pachys]|uniref:Uncharacterized protein n=1 Tax=Diploscapter pachys TaxID=2018661 RepID=A0A2A2JKW7_9BILA|nr:hypothetical protein WR25_16726 [Diploscapter pachys]
MDKLVQAFGFISPSTTGACSKNDEIRSKDEALYRRKKTIGSTCQIFYEKDPFMVSQASMQYLYDENGTKYLDCISNVQHVGHCHPKVVAAISKQLATSTCNVRFVSHKLTDCAEEILKTLPGLDTVLFCNSGSEANDLALRLARDYTQHKDAIVVDQYAFQVLNLNNPEKLEKAGQVYADMVKDVIEKAEQNGRKIAAFFTEALQSCGGQVLPPPGYLKLVAEYVRSHGGLMVIDEVQTGFGRVGSKYWAHQLSEDDFIPDIVTMGKPMGNGFPVSAVVTTKKIADKLGGSVGYFNTYGGNPVACSAALSVMNVIKEENLLDHSQKMGELFHEQLNELKKNHDCIGDIRGVGLFWGIDLVKDRETREPDQELALQLILKLRKERSILLNADGPYTNILKIKPPLCFNADDVKNTVTALDETLKEMNK